MEMVQQSDPYCRIRRLYDFYIIISMNSECWNYPSLCLQLTSAHTLQTLNETFMSNHTLQHKEIFQIAVPLINIHQKIHITTGGFLYQVYHVGHANQIPLNLSFEQYNKSSFCSRNMSDQNGIFRCLFQCCNFQYLYFAIVEDSRVSTVCIISSVC